jgi:NADH-quinone oxidoreductase subunit L
VAYSTISQLGYMMAANGASAFSAGIFHLSTHACFKALLFLGAGSVICAMHHEQDMRLMGGLRRYMPVTYVCFLVGAYALSAFPPFSGYYSKDAIIEAVHLSSLPGAQYAYICLLCGAFVTALYTFRAFFMTFHGNERIPDQIKPHVKESPWTICLPLVLLAIPSLLLGLWLVGPILYQANPILSDAITVAPQYGVLAKMALAYQGVFHATLEALTSLPFWFALGGLLTAYCCYVRFPSWPAVVVNHVRWVYQVLLYKFGFDAFNDWFFVRGTRILSQFFYRRGDVQLIDRWAIHGSCEQVNRFAWLLRMLQTGYVYHYALAVVLGMVIFLCLVLA